MTTIEINESKLSWLKSYKKRISKKARHLHISISPHKGLEVVIPNKIKNIDVDNFLNSKKDWIIKNINRLPTQIENITLPKTINIIAFDKILHVEYLKTESSTIKVFSSKNNLKLVGNIDNEKLCIKALTKYLKKQADILLNELLKILSEQTNLSYNKTSIRAQNTLWASCTSKSNISMNFKLLFLPFDLTKHVLLHELCHTIHLNHSKKFWALLTKHDPNTKINNYKLRKAQNYIPTWLNHLN